MSKTRSCTVQCVCTPLQVQPPAAASAGSGYETGGGAGSDSSYLTRHQSQSSPQKQVTLCCLLSLQKMSSSRRGRRLCLNLNIFCMLITKYINNGDHTTLLLTIGDNYSWLLPAQNVHRYLDHGWSLDSCIARLQNSIPAHCLLSLNSALPTPLRILQITRTEVELSPFSVWLLFHQRVSVVSNIKIEKPLCCLHAALTSISDENIIGHWHNIVGWDILFLPGSGTDAA